MRFLAALGAVCALVACSPEIPDSGAGAGVGFGDYSTYMRDQERARVATAPASIVPSPQVVSLPPQQSGSRLQPVRTAGAQGAPIQAGTLQGGAIQTSPLSAPMAAPQQVAAATPQASAPQGSGTPGPVSTQDFPTLAAGQQGGPVSYPAPAQGQVEMVAASALPQRPGDIPNIVEYALGTRQSVGDRVWRRTALTMQNTDRNCRGFVNSDLAQEEFLRRGGPGRDPLNLDPDGDGFACWWDPAPFRSAAARAAN